MIEPKNPEHAHKCLMLVSSSSTHKAAKAYLDGYAGINNFPNYPSYDKEFYEFWRLKGAEYKDNEMHYKNFLLNQVKEIDK